MIPELYFPIGLLLLASIIIVYALLIAPSMKRSKISSYLTSQGWREGPIGNEQSWQAILTLAIEDRHGKFQTRRYNEQFGKRVLKSTVSEERRGKALAIFRHPEGNPDRFAIIGQSSQRFHRKQGWWHTKKRTYTMNELWIGEARKLAVSEPELVFDFFQEMFGTKAKQMAAKRGVDPQDLPLLKDVSDGACAGSVRAQLQKSTLVEDIRGKVYIAPDAWVLKMPMSRAANRMEEVLALICDISRAIDRHAQSS